MAMLSRDPSLDADGHRDHEADEGDGGEHDARGLL
jgi:hypothetical protein